MTLILKDKEGNVKIDHKIKTDAKYPAGVMDVLSLPKTGEHFRVLYDVKGRFVLKKISAEEANVRNFVISVQTLQSDSEGNRPKQNPLHCYQ